MDDSQALSVSEFLALVNQTLEFAYPQVSVEGEISGYQVRQDKWISFDLKDEQEAAVVSCFGTVWQIKGEFEDGMRVRVVARPRIYTKNGRFSLSVQSIDPVGEGALKRAFELLKQKLTLEGLFAVERKRPLPGYPATIGLIASTDSAAYRDFIKILNARWGGVTVQAAHVQVQGEPAPSQIVAALEYFNQLSTPVDILVLTRGGGSLGDLQAFNTESVARAVAGSRTPIVVGVGHEQDVTLADLAADMRASTPSNAAELVVPDRREVTSELSGIQRQLLMRMERLITNLAQAVSQSADGLSRFLRFPGEQVQDLTHRLHTGMAQSTRYHQQQLLSLYRALANLDPKRVLARGYAIIRASGRIVKSGRDVKAGDELRLELAQDEIISEVTNVRFGEQTD